ncbi:MAG: hypothetical protein AVDCRST_MAG48-1841 [uncultured Friedmanniella sp.]|uniref:Uncharacterized protein n=1 Tax=uncultured Friedmanniella sp. TaxID=335381 RepID=A0A6J4KJP7_9ACTN|nr:MAG: hypothetical protein AVDCRST_MAG48-1841 [uncultured Friedmanniella sp.]
MSGPASRRSQGRKAGPSLMKKNVSTRTSTAVITLDVTADTPVKTPAAIWVALPCTRSMTAAVRVSMRSSARFTGGPVSHSWTCSMPVTALLASSTDWLTIGWVAAATSPPKASSAPSSTVPAASADGQRCRTSQPTGGRSTVERISASRIGRTPTQTSPSSRKSRASATPMTISRSAHAAIAFRPSPMTVLRSTRTATVTSGSGGATDSAVLPAPPVSTVAPVAGRTGGCSSRRPRSSTGRRRRRRRRGVDLGTPQCLSA